MYNLISAAVMKTTKVLQFKRHVLQTLFYTTLTRRTSSLDSERVKNTDLGLVNVSSVQSDIQVPADLKQLQYTRSEAKRQAEAFTGCPLFDQT
ncbi:hypothetical protein DPMN_137997 [Dreissena polymorpha]|uniref:Uncharacterized protein n=1 Tax=Dreissena polymorpha TaxID=45954 RepID=A0A9D4G3P8_DREPO|nr:hypothetical protein DPMN_137997 [Dreissena polymorpha]